jgi:hypothetical protein
MNLLRYPVYLLLALLSCGYLTASNLRGWSPWQIFASGPATRGLNGPATRHK